MIKVSVTNNTITLKGHANFNDYGKDIVCASVSSIITTSVNNMYVVNKESFTYKDDGNTLIIKILKNDELILKLFNNLIKLLKNLEEGYPKNIKIESEE